MTCGIYKLSFTGTNRVYIGKSKDILSRFIRHKSSMRSSLSSKKLLDAYRMYGEPALTILEELPEDNLDAAEERYIKQYDAVLSGFNSVWASTGDKSGVQGEDRVNALYTNEVYGDILRLLATTNLPVLEISDILDVSKNVVSQIKQLVTHTWLKKVYPEEYSIIEGKLKVYKETGNSLEYIGVSKKIVSPQGTEYEVKCINAFAKEHGLDSTCLCRVLTGEYASHKFWRLPSNYKKPPTISSPDGTHYTLDNISIMAFSKLYGLDNSSISKMIKGTKPSYKGWSLVKNV